MRPSPYITGHADMRVVDTIIAVALATAGITLDDTDAAPDGGGEASDRDKTGPDHRDYRRQRPRRPRQPPRRSRRHPAAAAGMAAPWTTTRTGVAARTAATGATAITAAPATAAGPGAPAVTPAEPTPPGPRPAPAAAPRTLSPPMRCRRYGTPSPGSP